MDIAMNQAVIYTISLLAPLVVSTPAASADKTRLTLGTYVSSGDYGNADTTEIQSVSLSVQHKTERWRFKASTAYLRISGVSSVLPDGGVGPAATTSNTRSGIGDLILSVSNLVHYNADAKAGFSVRGKIKVPTADEDKRLGTGKFDYTLELAPFKKIGNNTWFGGLGYKVYGDTPTTDYNNVWLAKVGVSHRFDASHAAGLLFNTRQNTTASNTGRRSLMAFHTYKFDKQLKLQTFISGGLSESTADLAGGLSLIYDL